MGRLAAFLLSALAIQNNSIQEAQAARMEQLVEENQQRAEPGLGRPAPTRRFDHLRTVVLAIMLAFGIRTGLAQAYLVDGLSMQPTLTDGQRVLVVKYPYGLTLPAAEQALVSWSAPARGEVVILASPVDGMDLVKRVVAVEGDAVELRQGHVLVNGTPLATGRAGACAQRGAAEMCQWEEERFAGMRWVTRRSPISLPDERAPLIVPPGHVFVLGDHRDRSTDSRAFGAVEVARIRGRVVFVD